MSFSLAAIVPSYNHYRHIATVVDALQAHGLRIFIIDDGSQEPAKSALAQFDDPAQGITLHRQPENGGKGAAVMAGFRLAADEGYTHVLQIDADGQHDLEALPALIQLAEIHPEALISGQPIYDETVPVLRKFARWITHVWVWIETLSTVITDSMCGYRIYPLRAAVDIIDRETVGYYMDFDTEIMVRMYWRGTPVRMLPIHVTYPEDNISNFRLGADNWLITKMHTRLVFGMLRRLPKFPFNRKEDSRSLSHWGRINERGATLGLKILFSIYRIAGRRICWYAMQPVLLYFFATGREQREASRIYWRRLYLARGEDREPSLLDIWRHYRSFAAMALDKLAAWLGTIQINDIFSEDLASLDALANRKPGIMVVTSHLGNVDILRAVGAARGIKNITVFAHTRNAVRFTNILSKANPAATVDIMEVQDIGPATLIELQEKLAAGNWVVIAGDRIPLEGSKRIRMLDFLGAPAPFSEGGWLIAALLGSPVYALHCLRDGEKFRILFDKITDRVNRPRPPKDGLEAPMTEYVRILQENCQKYPDQWYNFYDFWAVPEQINMPDKKHEETT
ncbi:glycosyltransferase family 2 protein [Sneathiella litorea]|uniref:Glycosyltransferase n=1 Tax=Sneathiella litorea TaxID=2606216 RepID=A0A6L8WDI4_9PROT|nr:glycosyltransferase family 2 protein [Sneathiella litorea]MZR32217.1 glycosyltransferase [Sneathiella litorea]